MSDPTKQPTHRCPWFGDCPPRYDGTPLPGTASRCGVCRALVVCAQMLRSVKKP